MKCWHCKTELIWGGDHDLEDNEDYTMVTNLSCSSCDTYVEVYLPKSKCLSIQCEVCGNTMENVDNKLKCKYCENFYPYDIAKDWMNFIIKNSNESEEEKE